MLKPMHPLLLALLPLVALAAACPGRPPDIDDDRPEPGDDAGPGPDDAGPGDDAGPEPEPDAGPGPEVTALTHSGAYVAASVGDVLTSDATPVILAGTVGTIVDPLWFDLGGTDPILAAGLVAHDTSTATTRVYTSDDGLPTDAYFDVPELTATVPFFDLEWIDEGVTFAAASWSHVVRGVIDEADHHLSFTAVTLRAPGQSADAQVTSVVMSGGELFVGSDEGVAVLDPDTLELVRWLDLPAGLQWVFGLSAGQLDGDAVVALAGPVDGEATTAVLAHPGASATTGFTFDAGTVPTAVLGMNGAFLVGTLSTSAGGAIAILGHTIGDTNLDTWVAAGELVGDAGEVIVPAKLAYDAIGQRVLVGGQVLAGSLRGGGLVAIPADDVGGRLGDPVDLLERRDPQRGFLPATVDVLSVSARGDVYVAGRELCSETRLGRVPLVRLETYDRETRVARPWVSGVRAIVDDPASEETWLSLRDEIPGLRCEGIVVAQNVCRLRLDGSCEIYTPFVNEELQRYPVRIGASGIAFGDVDRQEMAIATRHDLTYVRVGNHSRSLATQFDPSISLDTTSVAWGDSGLWIGSEMAWENFNSPDIDDEDANARGPHGLAYLELADDARPTVSRRYVSQKPADTLSRDEVEGLPSNWVWDVLPLPGARRALVANGVERLARAYDHLQPNVSGQGVNGGLALIDDEVITTIPPPGGLAYEDTVDLAVADDGTIYALDSAIGILSVDVDNASAEQVLALSFATNERPQVLAILLDGSFVVGTNRGLRLYTPDGGFTPVDVAGGTGAVWSLRVLDDGVLEVGCDQGLLVVAVGGAALPAALGPEGPLARDWQPLDYGCYGEDGCPCDPGIGAECARDVTCEVDPGGLSATCHADDGCGGVVGCFCDETTRCDPGLVCGASNTCEEQPPVDTCAQDCSCATLSGCPDGMICQGGFAGFSCI